VQRLAVLGTVLGAVGLLAAPAAGAGHELPARFPAAGELVRDTVVRAGPSPSARVVRTMRRFRADLQFQVVLALGSRRGADGARWIRVSLPGPPNGARGWLRENAVDLRPVTNRVVVRLAARRLEVRRVRDGKVLLRAVAAVGAPGSTTPLGRSYFVESAFVPADPFYGSYALETSAYTRVTDWPGEGVVGIHGTNRPALLGQAVSHGCIRVANAVATRLRRLAPPGTPIDVVP
jgi:L,D-transpeptidase catalytic domain